MVKKVQSIDWSRLQVLADKMPAAAELFRQLLDLFSRPRAVMATEHHADECMHDCLQDQQTDLVNALVHNAHLQECCCQPGDVTPTV